MERRPTVADVAAFDFDGTLTEGGSVYGFLVALSGSDKVLRATAALSPRLAYAALAGGTAADDTKQLLFERVIGGASVEDLDRTAKSYAEAHLAKHLRTDVRSRLDWHRDRGDRVVIVSASPEVYVKVAGHLLGVDGVIATRLEVTGNATLTGRYDGRNCRGEEKLRRLRQWIDDSGLAVDKLWSYGNSRGDLRMLRASDVGVNVGRLGRLGKLRSFPGLDETAQPSS
jgi:phosphatidylglycerophosphatase C